MASSTSVALKILEKIKQDGLEHYNRYYGIYRGKCIDNLDPEEMGRVKVSVPSIVGSDSEVPLAAWAFPKALYSGSEMGFFFPPEIDSFVWVCFEGGDVSHPVYEGGFWTGREGTSQYPTMETAGTSETSAGAGEVPPYPSVRGIITKYGNKVLLRDGDETAEVPPVNPGIRIETGLGSYVEINDTADGQIIEIKCSTGQTVTIDGTSGSEKVEIVEPTGDTSIILDATGAMIKSSTTVMVECPDIQIGGMDQPFCLETFVTDYLGHQHMGNMGAPTPLFPVDTVKGNLGVMPGGGYLTNKPQNEIKGAG